MVGGCAGLSESLSFSSSTVVGGVEGTDCFLRCGDRLNLNFGGIFTTDFDFLCVGKWLARLPLLAKVLEHFGHLTRFFSILLLYAPLRIADQGPFIVSFNSKLWKKTLYTQNSYTDFG